MSWSSSFVMSFSSFEEACVETHVGLSVDASKDVWNWREVRCMTKILLIPLKSRNSSTLLLSIIVHVISWQYFIAVFVICSCYSLCVVKMMTALLLYFLFEILFRLLTLTKSQDGKPKVFNNFSHSPLYRFHIVGDIIIMKCRSWSLRIKLTLCYVYALNSYSQSIVSVKCQV